jgi:hypothetical protein
MSSGRNKELASSKDKEFHPVMTGSPVKLLQIRAPSLPPPPAKKIAKKSQRRHQQYSN